VPTWDNEYASLIQAYLSLSPRPVGSAEVLAELEWDRLDIQTLDS